MKNFLALFLSGIFLISYIACNDDDDSGISTAPLEGTVWVTTSFVATNCNDPGDNEPQTSVSCTSTDCETLIMQNGNFAVTTVSGGQTEIMTGTYTISGNVLSVTMVFDSQSVSFDITYMIVGNVLTFDFTDPDGCDIVQVFQAQS
jgi:hypothetical protein